MSFISPALYFSYLTKLYLKNLLAILLGLSFAFAIIDFFQNMQSLNVAGNYQILYVFYMWQEALSLLYPLALVFAVIMTKISLVKNNTMGAFHAFGYSKKRLFLPLLFVASITYLLFTFLHTTEFSYAKDKANLLRSNQVGAYDVHDLFFKYNDTFVYIKNLDPIKKKIEDITIFKVEGHKVHYTINAPYATFDGEMWDARNATLKSHIYVDGQLQKYKVEYKESIRTLKGYKPKIIKSLHEGKALSIIDAYHTWRLLEKQHVNSDKIRAKLYEKVIVPLFAIALLMILFFKLPFHTRMVNLGAVVALALGSTFLIWGVLFGLGRIGSNGVLPPELTSILPILILWAFALYVYITNEKNLV